MKTENEGQHICRDEKLTWIGPAVCQQHAEQLTKRGRVRLSRIGYLRLNRTPPVCVVAIQGRVIKINKRNFVAVVVEG